MTLRPEYADPLITALHAARSAGNPVVDGDSQRWPGMILSVRRRWGSYAHRHPAPSPDTLAARVEDLARGLLARCAGRPGERTLIEITDCRQLARRLALVLSAPSAAMPGGVDPGRWAR